MTKMWNWAPVVDGADRFCSGRDESPPKRLNDSIKNSDVGV